MKRLAFFRLYISVTSTLLASHLKMKLKQSCCLSLLSYKMYMTFVEH